ncbi:MAG: hypothetical protein IJJ82_01945 [Clostridia bacterium]|nr:hypothetical protein [Clostridia bacterium]
MKEKLNKIRGLIILLLLVVLSANSNLLFSIAKESEQSINTENIVATSNVVLEKYINYESETEKGLLMQYSVDVGTEYKNDENHVPLVATGLLFNAPKVENEFPETVNIIAKSTLLTNGSDEGKDYKFVYRKETGAIAIVTSNNQNEEGNIYEEYKQNAKDSFSIILNYGENAYNSENKERNLSVTGRIVEILNTEEKTRIENSFENTQIVKENISKLVSTKVENTNVYNGYIKSNVVNGTNYETAYKENVQINISKDNLGTQKIDLTQKFINKNGEAIETENIVFKSSKMEKQNILDVLGEEGTLKILDNQEQVLAEINKDTESNEDGTIKIDYPEGTTKITLELSNAIKTGNITIQNEKEIKAEEKNLELSKIQEIYNQDEITNIEIQDSKTEVTIEPSLTTWTNEKQNEVEFKVSLHNNSSKYNLFKNPVIAIQLPEETEKVLLNETATLTNANGLKIKNTEYNTENRTIRVELEGEQTKYLSPALEDGTIIKIPAVIILSNNIESKEIDLKSAYQNENNYTGNTETEVIKNKIILENFNQTLMPENTIQKMTRSLASAAPTSGTEETQENVVPTAQGISISVKPVIGDVTRDTVYEGEFIKYEITATNTTNQDIDNVKILATLPEGVTYGELVREDHEPFVESYYDFEKQLQPIEIGTIKAGKTESSYFEVKVNDLADGENNKNITTKIQAFVGDGLIDEKEITHQANKAEYKVFLSSYVYRAHVFKYKLKIIGEGTEKQNVKISLPECMEAYKLENEDYSDSDAMTFENVSEVSANLAPGNYLIYANVNSNKIPYQKGKASTEVKAVATINDIYKSNENRIYLEYEAVTIKMSSDNEGKLVKYGDEVNYKIDITNIGKSNYGSENSSYIQVVLTDKLPEQLIPIEATYNYYVINRDYDANNTESIPYTEKTDGKYSLTDKEVDENGNEKSFKINQLYIPYGKTITIQIKAKANIVYDKMVISNEAVVSQESLVMYGTTYNTPINPIVSNKISHTIVPLNYKESNIPDEPDTPDTPDEPGTPDTPDTPDEPGIPDTPDQQEVKKYNINGYVWNDKNEDGEKQNDEQSLSGIQTYLLNAKGDIAKETKTDNNGNYIFADIENGEYNVVFKYNTNQYRITKYKVSRVSESANSNATKQEVVINGEKITAGVTEQITLNKDIENINLGLIENKKFDFKVDNYISKITVKTKNGTTEIPYSNANLAKAEINAKEIEGAVVTVEYKIVVTNNGEINGTVGRIIDYIPEGVNLTQDMTSEWINNNDGSYVNNSLANKIIKPGKSEEITLKITRELTENSTGLYKNSVKIDSIKNQLEIEELSLQNNTSNADFIISISTGALTYILFIVLIISIIVIVLNYKFNIINKFKISILTIIGSIFIVIIMQVSYPSKAADIDWSKYSETRHIYLTAAHISEGDRLRDTKETLTGIIYSDSHKVNLHTKWYLKFFGSDLYEIPSRHSTKEKGNVIEYNMDTSDIYQLINNYNFDTGASISRSENVVFFNHDWRAFFELDDDAGEKIYYQDGEYYLDGTPRFFGRCIDETKDGGPFAINITNLGWDAEILVRNNVYDYNVNAYYPIYATWTCTGNWWDLYYDGDGEYGYFVENETPTPEFNITGNGNETIRIKDFDNSNYLIGPFSITRNDQNTDYTFEIIGSNGNIGQSDFLTCDANGNYKRVKGRCPEFYLKVNKNKIKNINRILKVELTTEDVEYTYDCDITAVGKKIYSCPGYQEVAGDTPYIPFEPEQRKIHSNYEWNYFPGAITIQKSDEIGKDENGNTLSMEGINFIVNKFKDGWAVYDNQGNITYGDIDSNHKPVIFTTDATGRTQTIVGFDTVSNTTVALEDGTTKEIMQNIDGSTYMAFEIIDDNYNGDGNYYGLPNDDRHLSDYYKATYSAGQLWGCPYSLKSLGNGNLKNFDGSNDSVYDDFDMSRQYYNPDTYPVEYFGEFLNGNSPIHFIYSGEFETFNVTNTRDYVSLQIDKKDHYNGTFDNNYAGIRFKVCKLDEDGTYKWVHKVNPSDPHSEVTYGSFNGAYELTTDKYGKTGVLKKLDNGGTYWIVETYIPPQLEEYYTLHSANDVYRVAGSNSTLYKYFFDQYNIDLKDSQNRDNKIKLLSSTSNEFTLLQPKKIYVKKPQGETATNVVDTGYGKFSWQGWNPRDYFAIQIYKQNERNTNGNTTHDPLNDIEFAILEESKDSTESNYKGGWVATDNNGIYNSSLIPNYDSISNIRTARYITGENGENGYTRMVRRIPMPPLGQVKKYSIFEINASDYEDLYKLGQFRFNGTLKDGKCIETITINNEFKKDLWKEPTRTTNTNVKIYNVKLVNYTNIQDYGSLQIQKVDELTKTPLNNIGLRIRMQTGKWLIINDKKSGVINSNDTSKKEVTGFTDDIYEATEIRTNAQGYTDTIYKVPIDGYQMMNTYSAYETYIPENLRSYYALNSDFTKYAPSNCTAAQYRSFENAAIYELKATTVRSYLNTINSLRSQAGAAPIANLALTDVARLVAYGKITRDIDKNDITKPVITEFEAQNEQNYINISGYVWEDAKPAGKVTDIDNKRSSIGTGEYKDKNLNNITVKLVKRINGASLTITSVVTGSIKDSNNNPINGYYRFEKLKLKDLANYYIEFTYDGITYESVVPEYTTENARLDVKKYITNTNSWVDATRTVQIPNSKTSKATEVASGRDALNNAFGEIKGEGQTINYKNSNITLKYTTKNEIVYLDNTYAPYLTTSGANTTVDNTKSYNYLITSRIDEYQSGRTVLEYFYNYMANNQTALGTDGYENNRKTLLTEIPNLNLGLYRREQPNLTLQKDVYKAEMQINGKKYVYRYDRVLEKDPANYSEVEQNTGILGVNFDGRYTLPMYEADMFYGDESAYSPTVSNTVSDDEKLKASVTYKIKLQNTASELDTKIHEIHEVYSKEYSIARNASNKPLIYLIDKPNATNADFNEENRINIIENTTTYKLDKNYTIGTAYKESNIRFETPITIEKHSGNNVRYLYIVFNVNIEDIKPYYKDNSIYEIGKCNLKNVAEISSYSVTKNNKKYAHVDYTSIPGNADIIRLFNYTAYNGEDDDDKAPGLKVIKPSQRNITGVVFEDAPVQCEDKNNNGICDSDEKNYDINNSKTIDPGEERIGNGILNGPIKADIGSDGYISGIKVKLVDSDGNYAQFYDESSHAWKEQTYEISGSNGIFKMSGFIPGDYRVEFVWGEGAGGKDVSRYKCTILSNPNITNKDTVQYDGEIEYNAGYDWLTENKNYSDAKDDYIRRLAIDKLNLKVDDSAYDGLTASDGTTPLLDKVNEYINKFGTDGEDDNSLKYMHSLTSKISIEVEKNGTKDAQGYVNSPRTEIDKLIKKDSEISAFKGLGFDIKKVDFGIIERPKRAMSVQKRIKSIKITTPEGRPVVIATIGIDGKVNAIAGEQYISGGYKLGYLYAQIDKNLLQSMKVEVEYEVAVSGLSELDYDYVGYYLYAIPKDGTELKLKATNLYDYVGGATITTDSKDEDRWQSAELTDEYLKVPTVGEINSVTATEKLIMDIFNYVPSWDTQKVGKQNSEKEVIKVIDEMGLYDNVDTLTNTITAKEAKETLAKIYTKLIDDWDNSEYENQNELNEKIIRALKLKNREVVQGDPNTNTLVKDYYESTETRVGKIKISKIISNGENIDLNNDIEIASVAVDTTQKTGANADPTYAPLYDRAEYVTVSPAQGEDKDYVGKAIVGIGILTVLASGIILIKRYVSSK